MPTTSQIEHPAFYSLRLATPDGETQTTVTEEAGAAMRPSDRIVASYRVGRWTRAIYLNDWRLVE